MMQMVDGYKTYMIVMAFMLASIVEGVLGFDIPGFTVSENWVAIALGMLGIGTLRAGIKKDTGNT